MGNRITVSQGITLLVRRSARARRMTLRVPRDGGQPVLTLPKSVALSEGQAFAESKAEWLQAAVARMPGPSIIGHGSVLPVEGQRLIVTPASVRMVQIEGGHLLVPSARPTGPVIQAFLKHRAHQRLGPACDRFAAALGKPVRAIALRDTKSRWGSCTSDGRLMFSWRLAMAPPVVLEYVAAHEVAHLAHMDHSPRFWAAVDALMPGYGVLGPGCAITEQS
ncbi:M48 family metallopeptidase [Paracoccus amoyensis]|uniref:M48 family metallopeptidase n=1 Tax=Paracoccus amoyensis TaxID=2760093 RepID=UPI001FEB2FF3|nr:SprT family zinc-dependent metalloprotease [Paracoccus amoyensis]